MDELNGERRRLADATRSVIRATRVTQVDADAMTRATALLDEAASLLQAQEFAGPHCQVGFELEYEFGPEATPGAIFAGGPADFFPFSPVIGPFNPLSLPLE